MDNKVVACEMTKIIDNKFISDASHCEDVNSWYCEDFLLDMYAEKDWDNYPEIRDEIMGLLKRFAAKYDPINEPAEPFEDQIYIGDCPTVKKEELPEFVESLQKILDLAGEANASVGLEATFISDSGYPHAAMMLEINKDFRISAKYYRA